MSDPLSDEQRALTSPPKGTFALMLLIGVVFGATWLFLYLVRFLGHGPVS